MAPEADKSTTTIAILGADTVVENALALLLADVGYDTKVLEEPSAANTEEQLQGVDLLLLMPSLRDETQEGYLKAIEATPAATAGIPVLALSTAPQDEMNGRTGMVPWPTPLENLRLAIGDALAPAPSSEPGDVERLPSKPAGHGDAAAREECA